MSTKLTTLILASLGLNTACMSTGRDFSSDLSWIKLQETKDQEARRILGEPKMVGSSGGTPTWTYQFIKYNWGEVYNKELKLYFSDKNTIKDFSFTSGFPADKDRSLGSKP